MSITDMILATFVVVLGATGTYLMLPHRHGRARPRRLYGAGLVAAGLGLLMFLGFSGPPASFLPTVFLYVFGLSAIVSGALTVTSRNPIYSALWFASVVLSTAGLFLLADAPFLAAGTVIVYAGAIIVTFLFVIMLAQMEGKADYDRAARAAGAATITSYLLLWSLIVALSTVHPGPVENPSANAQRQRLESEKRLQRSHEIIEYRQETNSALVTVVDRALTRTSQVFESPPSPLVVPPGQDRARFEGAPARPEPETVAVVKPNVAGLGASLYTDHLVTVGLAGALLFVALIGAVAITNPKRPGTAAADQ